MDEEDADEDSFTGPSTQDQIIEALKADRLKRAQQLKLKRARVAATPRPDSEEAPPSRIAHAPQPLAWKPLPADQVGCIDSLALDISH